MERGKLRLLKPPQEFRTPGGTARTSDGWLPRMSRSTLFFQAKAGIRCLTVTGVQTCALPIWARKWPAGSSRSAMAHVAVATPNTVCERIPGDLIGPIYFEKPLTAAPLRYNADRLFVPEGPEIGRAHL